MIAAIAAAPGREPRADPLRGCPVAIGRERVLGGSVMLSDDIILELHDAWLPHVNDAGLDRVVDLLEKGSPLLLSGRFTEALPRGCLATHIGWHHPAVSHRTLDAGILW